MAWGGEGTQGLEYYKILAIKSIRPLSLIYLLGKHNTNIYIYLNLSNHVLLLLYCKNGNEPWGMLGVHSAVDVHAWSSLGRTPLLEGFSSKAEEATAVHPHRSPTVRGSILFLVHTPSNLATGKSAHLADGSAPLTAPRPHFKQSPRPQHMRGPSH